MLWNDLKWQLSLCFILIIYVLIDSNVSAVVVFAIYIVVFDKFCHR